MAAQAYRKPRWGDQLDVDEEDIMPAPSVTTSGNQRSVVEYFKNERGEMMKKTTRSKVVNVEKKVYEVR
jgi:translation initiation factor 3 subunit G